MPLEAIDPEKTQLLKHQLRLLVTSEYAEFDNFRQDGDDIVNPGGNRAILSSTTFFLDYGLSQRVTLSATVPLVRKRQFTNRFQKRVAQGLGDVALFGRYEVLSSYGTNWPSLAVGLGLKFPTGSIEEPGGDQARLPPAFQAGSGAYDLFPTLSYFQAFGKVSLFGNAFARLPLEANELGYRFGREYEGHFGFVVPLPVWNGKLQALVSADYLKADHDEDGRGLLPARLRDGTTVLNTGGEFLDFTPGLRLLLAQGVSVQARFFIPVAEQWNGLPVRNVGQVAPDLTTQLTVAYTPRTRARTQRTSTESSRPAR